MVDRGPLTKIPTVVFEHEIPILELLNGEGAVRPCDTDGLGGVGTVVELDPVQERNRLMARYANDGDTGRHPVELIYGMPSACTLKDAGVGGNQKEPEPEYEDDDDDDDPVSGMTRVQLMSALDEFGVEYTQSASKAELQDRLRIALRE